MAWRSFGERFYFGYGEAPIVAFHPKEVIEFYTVRVIVAEKDYEPAMSLGESGAHA